MSVPAGVEIAGPLNDRYQDILTAEALDFLAGLHRRFAGRRRDLLHRRVERERAVANGATLDFLPETRQVREDEWRVAVPAPGLVDRRVEITGPPTTAMAFTAAESGARIWLADLEDANTPLWENVISGQLTLRDAVHGRLTRGDADGGRQLSPAELPTIVLRPRGWHLTEKHLLVDGDRMPGGLVDFGLYVFHCAHALRDAGSGPYLYLPKLESHLEARLWNDVFLHAQRQLGLPVGTIRATVLVETLPAAFEMDEILHELREHSAGLNAGRWDYLFSMIKKLRSRGSDFLLPDRNSVTMTVPFLRAYTELLVRTCHRRGAHAIGGMSALIPDPADPAADRVTTARVREDKIREADDGFDGSGVAHPDLVPVCRQVFDRVLGGRPHQIDRTREDVRVTAEQLLDVKHTPGRRTEAGLRDAITVGIRYLSAWMAGSGAVAIDNLMEDAATAEISRSQVWQWLHNGVTLDDTGGRVTRDLIERIAYEEVDKLPGGRTGHAAARAFFVEMTAADTFVDFLTLPAYERMP